MSYQDLRAFLTDLSSRGLLVEIEEPLESPGELWAMLWELYERKGPAVKVRIKGHDIPLIANTFGSIDRWAMAAGLPLGAEESDYVDRFTKILESKSSYVEPIIVDTAPCKEIIKKGEEVDLHDFPILQWHHLDGGEFIDMGVVRTFDPDLGGNLGLYRMSILEKNVLKIVINAQQDIGLHAQRARARGENRMPCAITIGCDPAVILAAVTKIPPKKDEYEFAAAFREGKAVELVRCETNDLYVPASAEIVLEGEIVLDRVVEEGPFCEWPGYLEEPLMMPVVEINCITYRRDPLFITTTAGHPDSEEDCMRLINQISTFSSACKQRVTGFHAAALPRAGRGYTAVVAIKKRFPGFGKHAIMQVYGIPYITLIANNIIIVDEDIDPFNLEQVMWAISTRVDPERDVIIFPPTAIYPGNPASRYREMVWEKTGYTDVSVCSKMGIDATLKIFGKTEGHFRPAPIPVKPHPEWHQKVLANWDKYGFKE